MSHISIAIVGATGLVGTTLTAILQERHFPVDKIFFLASKQSAGKEVIFNNQSYLIESLDEFDFSQAKLSFFCVENAIAARYIPQAVSKGNIVIDKSFFYRNDADVPLVVPEVNLEALSGVSKKKIIASPNCNTIPIAVALKPIYSAVGINRVNIATYQSVSGTGKEAVSELMQQSRDINAGVKTTSSVYPQQIAYNVLPHIDEFEDNGYTREEMKMVWELKKIFADENISINPTAVRVPVVCGHAAAVHLETNEKLSVDDAVRLLSSSPGIIVIDGDFPYPTPVKDAAGSDLVFVGRIRKDLSHENGLNLWVVADNLRKGAALNAVQIAEHLIEGKMLT